MKPYLISFCVGLLVGAIYGGLQVRSPAPPVIALVGLLGILLGEQAPGLLRRAFSGHRIDIVAVRDHVHPHVFGRLPTRASGHASDSKSQAQS